jgi:hypothetical protein
MIGLILKGKRILAVDNEPDVLKVLEEEILVSCHKKEGGSWQNLF